MFVVNGHDPATIYWSAYAEQKQGANGINMTLFLRFWDWISELLWRYSDLFTSNLLLKG